MAYDVNFIIQIINSCQDLHVLPKPGGLLDQDSLFMYLYLKVQEYRAIRSELDSKKQAQQQATKVRGLQVPHM